MTRFCGVPVSVRFRLLTEADVKAVLTMDDLIETMTSALQRFSSAQVVQPVRPRSRWRPTRSSITMPAYVRGGDNGEAANPSRQARRLAPRSARSWSPLFGGNTARGLHTHLATDRPARSGDRRAAGAAGRALHHRGAHRGGIGGVVAAARARDRRSRSQSSGRASRRGATWRRCRGCTGCGR